MIILEFLGLILLLSVLLFFAVNYLDKSSKRRIYALVIVIIVGFCINCFALVFDLIKGGSKIAVDYFVALVRAGQYTAGLLVFNDKFDSLGILTSYNSFKIIYYIFMGIAYIIYTMTIISLFTYKTTSKLRLIFSKKDCVYCFTDVNEKSFSLAEDIMNKNPKAKVAFTLSNDIFASVPNKDLKKIKENHYILYCSPKDEDTSFLSTFGIIKLYKIKYIFAFSEKCEINIKFCKNNLNDDLEIYPLILEEYSDSIYLHKSNIHIIKEHDLASRMLIETHPAYKNIYKENDKNNINIIVIGRGRTGNEVFKNLYVTNPFKDINVEMTIFDKVDNNGFYELMYPLMYEDEKINYIKCDIYSMRFFKRLNLYLRPNNYIVVALGDDKKNIEISNLLYRYILANTNNKASIFAHIRDEKNKNLLENKLSDGVLVDSFGVETQLFSYEMIVGEILDIYAKAINDNYNKNNPKNACLWNDLSEFTKSSNRSVWISIPAKLYSLGLEIVDINDPREEISILELDSQLDYKGAYEEHTRWYRFHVVNGWRRLTIDESKSLSKDSKIRKIESRKKSLSLCSFEQLKEVSDYLGEDIQSYDYLWKEPLIYILHKYNKKIVKLRNI